MRIWSLVLMAMLLVETTLTNAAMLNFTGQTSATNATNASIVFYTGCYVPIDIRVNTLPASTTAIDVKFINSGSLVFQTGSSYIGWKTWTFTSYLNFPGTWPWYFPMGTGMATTGTYSGWTYNYINAQYTYPGLSNANALVATVYMKAITTTWVLDFYFFSGVNRDDSNVTSGVNSGTQYIDVLTGVSGTGLYTLSGSLACPFKAYLLSTGAWATYYSLLWSGISSSYSGIYTPAGDRTSLTNLTGLAVYNPTVGQYSGYITHQAARDINTGNYTSTNSWNIWTNKPIYLYLTGNEMMNMSSMNGLFASSSYNVKILSGSAYATSDIFRSTGKVIQITGNIYTGITFYNTIGNNSDWYASGATAYVSSAVIDVFWYDTENPSVTGLVSTWAGYADVRLSGYASAGVSDAANGWHAVWTTDDDAFRIVGFSGLNTMSYGYSSVTGYNADLNTRYVFPTGQDFSMLKSGYNANYTWAVRFTQTWSGYVYLSDIAGNVTGIFVNVNVTPKTTFEVRISPAFRDNGPGNGTYTGLATKADIWLAYSGANGTQTGWIFLHNSVLNVGDSQITFNAAGTGTVDMTPPASGSAYLIALKWTGMLSIGWTGIWQHDISNTWNNIIDFVHTWNTNALVSGLIHGTTYPSLIYSTTGYLEPGDVLGASIWAWDYINGGDLSLINTGLSIGQAFPSSTQQIYYDFDVNTFINAVEQAIIIQFSNTKWFIDTYATWGNATASITVPQLYKTGFSTSF